MWDRKQQLELDMEQLIGSKLGKEYDKAVYCPPAYSTYMQNTSCRRLDWRNPKPELRLLEEISTTSDMEMIPESEEELKNLVMRVKEESAKNGLKLNI